MKTGTCKFGPTCKFHHPKDISITTAEVENGNGGQMEAIMAVTNGNSAPSFIPAMLHNSKGLPIRPVLHLLTFYDSNLGLLKYAELLNAKFWNKIFVFLPVFSFFRG